jgi:hypothetical protein
LHPSNGLPAKDQPSQPTFSPFLYSLDLLLPVANLGQRNAFATQGVATWIAAACTVSGWLLGAILVAGLVDVFKRD